jgi:hypothetical protein
MKLDIKLNSKMTDRLRVINKDDLRLEIEFVTKTFGKSSEKFFCLILRNKAQAIINILRPVVI